jgi:tRNA dimethylallyltransferase
MNNLVVLIGPTAVGKTDTSFAIAERFGCPIISADSRQMYRGMEIGTAMPSREELARHKHYFVGQLSPGDYYSAARYEEDVLALLEKEFPEHPTMLMAGGSMMYIDSVCNGIDDIPTVDGETRAMILARYEQEGLDRLAAELRVLDPEYYNEADIKNPKRVMHALEICYMTGKTYSSFRRREKKQRPFNIIKVGLQRDREELYDRINRRVDIMIENGLVDEVKKLLEKGFRAGLTAQQAIGYKEIVLALDGEISIDEALQQIKVSTHRYAKRQRSWFRHDKRVNWITANEGINAEVLQAALDVIQQQ